ncbi:Nose resistant to fluoxetine protein 6 [Hypsibius exemplaris]|uniref:Nose resistant to fluoxetine protein 6 n=1 Tax=Hypsibius exemplaris TaxID=2072580 RepID=A0A1W0WZU9_HYPEX|nr:Nose resistant to fluoxetine protein 6 [Hypsibius exemplaris]
MFPGLAFIFHSILAPNFYSRSRIVLAGAWEISFCSQRLTRGYKNAVLACRLPSRGLDRGGVQHGGVGALHSYQKVAQSWTAALLNWMTVQAAAGGSPSSSLLGAMKESVEAPAVNISGDCLSSLMTLYGFVDIKHPENTPEWLIRFVDAQPKPPSAILEGDITWLGAFHECMNISQYRNSSKPTPASKLLVGQYCLVSVGVEEPGNYSVAKIRVSELLQIPKALRAGVCVPDSCSANDVRGLFEIALAALVTKFPDLGHENLSITDVKCPARLIPMDGPAITVIVILVAFATIVLIASLYDVLTNGFFRHHSDPLERNMDSASNYTPLSDTNTSDTDLDFTKDGGRSVLGRVCISLSAISNTRKLFGCGLAPAVGELRWIHGVRVLSMVWIILGQSYALGLPVFNNLAMLPEAMKGLFAQIIVQSTFAVDTFLFLSGFLVSYRFLGELAAGFDCFRLIRFYLNRYLRLFPVYMIILGVYAALTKYISSGPLWPQDEAMLGNCSSLAWSNAFYINNYIQPEQMCMPWTWYIAVDFQLFAIAPLIVVALYVVWQAGVALCAVGVLAAVVAAGVISKVMGLPPSLVGFGSTDVSAFDQDLTIKYFTSYLITTYCRAAPYFIGILAAFFLRDPAAVRKLGFFAVICGWFVALLSIAVVVFGLVPGFNGYPLSVDAAAAFNSLSHVAWAVALAWIAYSCMTGAVKGVDRVLGWSMWRPLSTISYSVYLISPIIICIYYLSREETIRFSHWNTLVVFGGNLVISFVLGYVVYIFIEAPVRSLVQLLMRRPTARKYSVNDDSKI